ncbi:MAG: energy-coupling factor transporter ATPase [Oscillospiraceae bacterium]|nr:energy-coupling factor transporter ATPase [Oscillospiraceae bacterium]
MNDIYLKTEKLRFSYAPQEGAAAAPVINDLDLEVEKGTFTAVIGRNGSGKSTLAKHFNAILLPQGGRVLVSGSDTADDKLLIEIRRRVGLLFQNPDNQIVATVVEEDVAFAPENLGCPPEDIRRRVDEALKAVGMYDYREHAPHLLSGGQKQRIAIAGILAMEPECIVFDEPTAMLDPRGRESILKVIRELRDKGGVTIVLITHHMDEAVDADRVVVLSNGEIAMDGAPRDVLLNAEALQESGLNVPDTVLILRELKEAGLEVDPCALTVDECASVIAASLLPAKYDSAPVREKSEQ